MLCIFGPKAIGQLDLKFERNPLICDCLDFEIYCIVRSFPRMSVLNNLFCEWPLEYRKELVHTLYFLGLINGDSNMCCAVFD
jgi:hypothetical protein